MQIGLLRGVSYVSYFRYTINAFVSLQYAQRDDGCGVMPVITPQERAAAYTAMQARSFSDSRTSVSTACLRPLR